MCQDTINQLYNTIKSGNINMNTLYVDRGQTKLQLYNDMFNKRLCNLKQLSAEYFSSCIKNISIIQNQHYNNQLIN